MIALALAFLALPISVPVHVTARVPASPNCIGVVSAKQVHGSGVVTSSIVDGVAALQVPEGGPWELSLNADSCWAAPLVVDLGASPGGAPHVELRSWPKGEITGTVSVPSHHRMPEVVFLQLTPAVSRGRSLQGDLLGTVACPVLEHKWHCGAPLTDLDIRLAADGFAPVYFWNIRFENARAPLPATVLQPGASLNGWVEDQEGHAVSAAEVRLTPQQLTRAAARTAGLSMKGATRHTNGRGFFQFDAVAVGDYEIVARTQAGDVSDSVPITIREGREQLLSDALIVERAATVIVQVTPPLAPDHQRWNLRMFRIHSADNALEPKATGHASELGAWRVEGVERGPYSIEVLDSTGSTVARLDEKVDRDPEMLDIPIGNVRVEGRVRFGNDPVAADLKFFSSDADVRMRSEDDGTFGGWLPSDGLWSVQISPREGLHHIRKQVKVEVPSDDTHATVNLDLPGGRVEGFVVDEQGKVMPRSDVRVLRGHDFLGNAGTDSNGHFVVRGLEAGPAVLFAENGELFSDYQQCTVSSTAATAETIVVRAPLDVRGELRHQSGAPAVGALIRYFRDELMFTAVSGPTGEFTLTLTAAARAADVVVISPRHSIVLDRVQLGQGKVVVVLPDIPAELRIALKHGAGLPRISRNGGRLLPIAILFAPQEGLEPPREFSHGEITLQIAPGLYNVCYAEGDCVGAVARSGEVTRVVAPSAGGK